MTAMALAAMTQELSVMKQSLQAEVGRPCAPAETSRYLRAFFRPRVTCSLSRSIYANDLMNDIVMQVESMKTELKRASDDSKRLTDKLCRLEDDNRQLEAMVSRLGGQDARKLKAQVTAASRHRS